ncbi:hypothetical protein WDZ92_52705, partial [Nostoc sp. NIES-2111]
MFEIIVAGAALREDIIELRVTDKTNEATSLVPYHPEAILSGDNLNDSPRPCVAIGPPYSIIASPAGNPVSEHLLSAGDVEDLIKSEKHLVGELTHLDGSWHRQLPAIGTETKLPTDP